MNREEKAKPGANGFTTTLRQFGETTSIKGIPRVFKAPRKSIRVLWGIATLGGVAFGTYLIIGLVSSYLSHGVHTTYSECPDCAPTFPDITVCNLNPSYEEPGTPMNSLFDLVLMMDGMTTQEQLIAMLGQEIDMETRDLFLGEFISLAGYYQNTVLMNVSKVLQTDIWKQLVVTCDWHGWNWNRHPKHDCMATSLYRVLSPEFQWCVTFHTNRTLNKQSDIRGLTSVMYMDDFSDAHIPKFLSDLRHAQSEGVRVVVHEPGTLPDLKLGFNVPVGHDTIIKLTAIERIRQPDPYSTCTDREFLESTEDVLENTVNYRYSYDGCMNLCKQRHVIQTCGCISAHIPFTPSILKSNHFCAQVTGGYGADSFVKGMQAAFCAMTINTSSIECDCPLPCKGIKYQHSVLATEWPHPAYQMAFYQQYIQKQPYGDKFQFYKDLIIQNMTNAEKKTALRNVDLINRNYLQLNIHFPQMSTWYHTDQVSLTGESLMGVLGGVLNLWMGVTFVTLVELLELCLNILRQSTKAKNYGLKRKDRTDVTELKSAPKPAWGTGESNQMPPVS